MDIEERQRVWGQTWATIFASLLLCIPAVLLFGLVVRIAMWALP